MDLMSMMSTMLSEDSINQMSQKTGTTNEDVKNVLLSALPAMLNGVQGQADGEDTVAGFAGALESHAQADTSDITAFLSNVDLEDGNKIVGHLLGADQKATTKAAAEKAGLSVGSTGNILSAAAPLLMSLLGQQTAQAQTQAQAQPQGFLSLGGSNTAQAASSSGGGLFGSLFGGGQQQSAASSGGGLLGSLFGGGQQQAAQTQQSAGGGNLLGSLIGGMLGNVDITSLLFSLLGSGK